ncbi:MAG TPA: nuclear transport factor 2 family protein [Ktedonobacteraceae bacterium]
MTTDAWIVELFETIDAMQAEKFAIYFAEESLFRFGNAVPARGRQAIEEALVPFFSSIAKLEHRITGVWHGEWEHGPVISVEANVIYTRKDGTRTEALPATSTIRMQADKIKDYRIFVDISPLFAGV